MFIFLNSFFFFNDTATTEIYTLSLHDALPISATRPISSRAVTRVALLRCERLQWRSEEHTSELQSRPHLVCRLLLEKKNPPLLLRTSRGTCLAARITALPT